MQQVKHVGAYERLLEVYKHLGDCDLARALQVRRLDL